MEIVKMAPAKINLGLDVVRKREDGYHEVKMVMQTLNLYDRLTFCDNNSGLVTISSNMTQAPATEDNIIYKACQLIKKEYGISSGIDVYLEKNIPVAAGMAGGSTDAAATLVALNEMFDLGLSRDVLMELGVKIGADVPYCIMQGTALSEGIGEILTPLCPMPKCYIAIAKPEVGVSTKWVYQNLDAAGLKNHPDIDKMVEAINTGDLKGIVDTMENVLETVTIPAYPQIESIKQAMINGGAAGALMSGSGPTVFGIFEEKAAAEAVTHSLKQKGLAAQVYVATPV